MDIAFNTQELMKLITEHPNQAILPATGLILIVAGITYGVIGMFKERKKVN